jgi:1,4-alpha-glucan branching enzyme
MKSRSTQGRPAKTRKSPVASSERPENGNRKEVVFQVTAPSAGTVALAADFTDWDKAPLRMLRLGDGVWQIKVALPKGRHSYKFLVDGRWLEDPHSPERIPNAFGTTDGVINVP